MQKRVLAILSIFFISFAGILSAQTTYDFLRVDMSPRAAALGGSFVTNNDDPEVIFYNPAGMYSLENSPASVSFVKHLLDINLASVVYSTELDGIGRVGAGIKYINYGSFDEADEFGNRTGTFNANEFAFVVGYAGNFEDNFNYGANVKFIYSGIADRSSTGVGVDLGVNYLIPSQMINIGASVLNLGAQMSSYINTKEDLPLDIVIGVSKRLENLPVRISLDFHRLNDDRDKFSQRFKAFTVGTEFYLSKVLTLRFGYDNERRSDLKVGTTAGIAGFNVGLGIHVSEYQFDYGYSSLGPVGALHRIGISTAL